MRGNYLAAPASTGSSRNYAGISPRRDATGVYCILYGNAPCFVKASRDSTDVNDIRGQAKPK